VRGMDRQRVCGTEGPSAATAQAEGLEVTSK
jgi:hypothetical protein